LLLPPLASTKEELTLFADPLLAQGHPVLRLDLPGQGESPPPLTPDAEGLLAAALDEAGVAGPLLAGGISLGAYFALRLAGRDPKRRVAGVFAVSPPAIVTPAQWGKQPEVIYQYLDRYFDAPTRADTLRIGLSMTLDDAVAEVTCPVLIYHATRDTISLPDAPARYRTALSRVSELTEHIVDDVHGCLNTLVARVVPEVAAWCARFTAAGE
jgi:pimeloyl-ACP methyl ester carboxylesterase